MPFKPGQSGNPSGRRKDSPWRDAIMRAVKRATAGSDAQALEKVADAVVAAAIAGDMTAAKEIGDRLDGKPIQAIEGSSEVTHYVVRMPTKPKTVEAWQQEHGPKASPTVQ